MADMKEEGHGTHFTRGWSMVPLEVRGSLHGEGCLWYWLLRCCPLSEDCGAPVGLSLINYGSNWSVRQSKSLSLILRRY